MDFPPPSRDVFPMEDYETAVPRDTGVLEVELMAQARPNGRVIDHFRLVVGGENLLEFAVPMSMIFDKQDLPQWDLFFSLWPRDIPISPKI